MSGLRLTIDGRPCEVEPGTSVAVAYWRHAGGANAGPRFRRSVAGEGRAPLCGMGICFECRLTVDGVAHRRSCLLPCADGMEIRGDA
jgi:sarcosine oxidase subunit alpha